MLTTYFLKCISEDIYKHQDDQKVPHCYYVGLSSSAPNVDGTNVTEPAAAEYSRVQVDNSADFGTADDHCTVSNNKRLQFPESQTAWGSFLYYVIYDEPTGGNLLMYGQLAAVIAIPERTIIALPPGSLKITTKNA